MPAEMLNIFDRGIFVLDAEGRALIVNGVAERLMKDHNLCHPDGAGALRSSHTRLDQALRQGRDGGVMVARVNLPDIGPVTVWLAPVPAGAEASGADRVAVIMTGDRARVSLDVLARMLEITQAEARVLHNLMAGKSLMECARALDLSYNTVRNQLNSVLSKTGARSQTELLLLIERLLPPIPFVD
jgi:DNA-binding CsgD family transcriptional regulator